MGPALRCAWQGPLGWGTHTRGLLLLRLRSAGTGLLLGSLTLPRPGPAVCLVPPACSGGICQVRQEAAGQAAARARRRRGPRRRRRRRRRGARLARACRRLARRLQCRRIHLAVHSPRVAGGVADVGAARRRLVGTDELQQRVQALLCSHTGTGRTCGQVGGWLEAGAHSRASQQRERQASGCTAAEAGSHLNSTTPHCPARRQEAAR